MYMFTPEQLQEFRRIAKAEFRLDFSDTEILEMATNLVRAFDVVLRAQHGTALTTEEDQKEKQ